MRSSNPKRQRPEAVIQKALVNRLRMEGWYVMETHGNMYQSGFPDVYATHFHHGARWIEVKLPGMIGSQFTNAQMRHFPLLIANGTRIWLLTGSSDEEYQKLFKPSNINFYLMGAM